ncbi:MAG: hypothetical protein DMG08_08770 [Acidobacteria bacterium]|nr:MAG: hypothetical protein DMG08_08770 [Acidobacteriota bacterium]
MAVPEAREKRPARAVHSGGAPRNLHLIPRPDGGNPALADDDHTVSDRSFLRRRVNQASDQRKIRSALSAR